MNEQQINEFIRLMDSIDGRDFFYNFCLVYCGVDLSVGIPSYRQSDYEQGVKKVAIDLFNLMFYNCPEKLDLMLQEQKMRRA